MTDEVREQTNASNRSNPRLDKAREFTARVQELSTGDLAVLKRSAGNTIAEARGVSWFYRLLDEEQRKHAEIHFLVATLIGLNKHNSSVDFGRSMGILMGKANPDAVERRFRILLDADFDRPDGYRPAGGELAFRLRQMVKLAGSHEVGIDWARLLADLQQWGNPTRYVQKRWAESFYTPPARQDQRGTNGSAEDPEDVTPNTMNMNREEKDNVS